MANKLQKTLITALAATTIGSQFSNIAIAAEPMEQTQTWGEYSILLDTSSIDVRMQRFEQNKSYRDALNHQAAKDTDTGYTRNLASNDFYSRYAIFYAVASNNNVTIQDALPFGGMSALDPASTALNHNLQYIVECRDEVNANWQGNKKSLLRINQIRTCAKDKAEEAYQLNITHPELMSSSLTQKLAEFDPDKNAPNDYTKSVMKRVAEMPYKSAENMPTAYHIRLWDAVFDPHTSWAQFKDLELTKKSKAFSESSAKFEIHTDHMGAFFDCRNQIVGSTPAVALQERQQQFNETIACWDQKLTDLKTEYHAKNSSFLVSDKDMDAHLRMINFYLQNTREEKPQSALMQSYWEILISTRKSFDAQYPTFGSSGLNARVISWKTSLNPDISWKDIQDKKDRSNHVIFKFMDPTTKNMTSNVSFLFECRDALLPDIMPETYRQKLNIFHEINQCWAEKAAAPNVTFEAEKQQVANRSTNVMQDMRPLSEKIADYNGWAEDKNPIMKPYSDAVSKEAEIQRQQTAFVGSDIDIITQWDSLLNTGISFETLKKGSPSVQLTHKSSISYTHNMQFVLDCRDSILSETTLEVSAETAKSLQDEILSCAKPQIQAQHAAHMRDIQSLRDTENFDDKTPDHEIDLFKRIVSNPKLNKSIYDHDGRTQDQDSSSLEFKDNLDIVFNCRADILKQEPSLTDNALYTKTSDCARPIIQKNHQERNGRNTILTIAFASAIGLGGIGYIGHRTLRARRRKSRALAN